LVSRLVSALCLTLSLLAAPQVPARRQAPQKKAPPKKVAVPVVPPSGKLIIISIDGLDSRFLRDADRTRLKIPTLRKLAAAGLTADVVGLAPTLTWPAHAVIATGVPPDQNAILDNTRPGHPDEHYWFERDLKATPLWAAATQLGLKAATIYWPSTVDAHAAINCPEFWEGAASNAIPFEQVTPKCTPGLIDRISKWDHSFVAPLWDDAVGIDVMRYVLTHENPDLVMLHLPELDAEQHETGAMSIYSRKVLENDDELLGTALQNAQPGSIIAIVSDHGFDTALYLVRPKVTLQAAKLSTAVQVKYGLIGVTDSRAAAILRRSIGAPRSGIAREVPMPEVRRLAPAAEVQGWVAAFDTTQGYIASDEERGRPVSAGNHKGVHGLWPTHDSSRALLILSGPGVRHARLPEISMLDLAPTFADVLGIQLPKAKGTSLFARPAR